ncbi:MAG: hypothetical protein IKO61_06165 [Lachnospiraceae bacterium]|nr:hypothetical protein [Lachnospiraceae bacterium]
MIARDNKDRLFRFIYGKEQNKKWTLELYNAVNGTAYTDENDMELISIESVLYMKMKNDVAFLLGGFINLYEHQSTYNPNMPLRELLYLSSMYERYVHMNGLNIYGKTQLMLPVPKLLVFYNGEDEMPDETILTLTSSFPEEFREQSDVEVRVRMININAGHSNEIMRNCRTLREYAWFVEKTREKLTESEISNMSEEEREIAKERAIDEVLDAMPEDFVIKPFLSANRAEVKHMLLTEYDEKKTMEMFARDARKEQRELDEKEIAQITAEKNAAVEEKNAAVEEKNAALEEVKRLKELLAQKS